MRFFALSVALALSMMCSPAHVQAQTIVAPQKSKDKETAVSQKKSYIVPQEQSNSDDDNNNPSSEPSSSKKHSGSNNDTDTCTAKDKSMLREHDELLTQYYTEVEALKKHGSNFESAEEIDKIQVKMKVFEDFVASDEYKEGMARRIPCEMPPPPRPYSWPSFIGIPDPMGIPELEEKFNE